MIIASIVHCNFRGLENLFFLDIKQFFSEQLVSAQILLALFPLHEFCSVANFKINCLAWHIWLDFLFDETGLIKKKAYATNPNFLYTKTYGPRKSQSFDCLTFWHLSRTTFSNLNLWIQSK